jgi:hypothetical protein
MNYSMFIMIWLKRKFRFFYFGTLVPLLCKINVVVPVYCKSFRRHQNIYKNEKCVIVGTGPSLQKDDIFALKSKGYKIIGVNSIVRFLSQEELDRVLDIYVIQDYQVFQKLEDDIVSRLTDKIVLFGSSIQYKRPFLTHSIGAFYPLHMLSHYRETFDKPYSTRFMNQPAFCVYDGYTVVYSAVQLATYMGFKEISLLGIDAGYSPNAEKRNVVNIQKIDPTWSTAGERINFSLNFAKKVLDERGLKMYNYTRGGNLSLIKRRDIEKVCD